MKTAVRSPASRAHATPVLAPSRGFGGESAGPASHDLAAVSVGVVQRVRTKGIPRRRQPGTTFVSIGGKTLLDTDAGGPIDGGDDKDVIDPIESDDEKEDLGPRPGSYDAHYETDSDDDERDPEHVSIQISQQGKGGTGELDGFRVRRKKIYEDKRGDVLGPVNPRAYSKKHDKLVSDLTEEERAEDWAEKQIFEKTKARIGYIAQGTGTEAPKKSKRPVPGIHDLQQTQRVKFRLESTHPKVKNAVRDQIDRLKLDPQTSHLTFTTKFGAGPAKVAPEDDPSSEYYVKKK